MTIRINIKIDQFIIIEIYESYDEENTTQT